MKFKKTACKYCDAVVFMAVFNGKEQICQQPFGKVGYEIDPHTCEYL